MKKQMLEELKEIRYLFNYNRGKIISEQEQFESEDDDDDNEDDNEYDDEDLNYLKSEYSEEYGSEKFPSFSPNGDMDTGEDLSPSFDSDGNFLGMVKPNRDGMEVDNDLSENRELEVPVKPGTKTPTKPDKDSPYKPKPGPKKKPKARKGDMPDWLSFDEIGINIE